MKKALLFICILCAVALTSCSKKAGTGYIQFISDSRNPYALYIDGTQMGILDGYGDVTYSIATGRHKCKVEQQSGYLFFPTVQTFNIRVHDGFTEVIEFP